MSHARQQHRDFLNRYYGLSKSIYDVTRKYYLFGRDEALRQLAAEPFERLVEIGPGTGRNLRRIRAMRPDVALGGVEASDEMLAWAEARCPWAKLVHGFAEDTPLDSLLGGRPDRILYSYCLSMVQDPHAALEHSRRQLAPGGEVVIVDFADLSGLAQPFRGGLRRWLDAFHVEPLDPAIYEPVAHRVEYGPGRYYVIARVPALADDSDRV